MAKEEELKVRRGARNHSEEMAEDEEWDNGMGKVTMWTVGTTALRMVTAMKKKWTVMTRAWMEMCAGSSEGADVYSIGSQEMKRVPVQAEALRENG